MHSTVLALGRATFLRSWMAAGGGDCLFSALVARGYDTTYYEHRRTERERGAFSGARGKGPGAYRCALKGPV